MRLINGPEAFTPDNEFILGPTDVRMRRRRLLRAPACAPAGWGAFVAEWIVEGVPSLDMWEMDSRCLATPIAARRTRSLQ